MDLVNGPTAFSIDAGSEARVRVDENLSVDGPGPVISADQFEPGASAAAFRGAKDIKSGSELRRRPLGLKKANIFLLGYLPVCFNVLACNRTKKRTEGGGKEEVSDIWTADSKRRMVVLPER